MASPTVTKGAQARHPGRAAAIAIAALAVLGALASVHGDNRAPDGAAMQRPPVKLAQGQVRDPYGLYGVPFGIDQGTCDRARLAGLVNKAGPSDGSAKPLGGNTGTTTMHLSATLAGKIGGVLVGNAIGRAMDVVDQNCVGRVLEYAPDRRGIFWRNPETGHDYTVVPIRTLLDSGGRYCREYQVTGIIDGRTEGIYGRACRRPDGTWDAVN